METDTAERNSVFEEGTLKFDVDSALLFQLGEELVAKRYVALSELVKNAYDADATQVILEFKGVTSPGGEIAILDDGLGMPFDTIERTWMRIATTVKNEHPVSPYYGRALAGEKGIGRFASRRLATDLEIQTVSANPTDDNEPREKTVIKFQWDDFKPGSDVRSINVPYKRLHTDEPAGTLLRLIGVRDAWSRNDIVNLRRDLVRLVNPILKGFPPPHGGDIKDPGFNIVFEFPDAEFKELSGSLSEEFLGSSFATLKGKIDPEGKPAYELIFRGAPKDRSAEVFTPDTTRFPSIGPASFEIHLFIYKKDYFAGLEMNVRDAQNLGREAGGIQIHYDGFRVPPYGDKRDDWLNLDYDRARRTEVFRQLPFDMRNLLDPSERPGLLLPGTNQVFGSVSLSRFNNPDIRQLANREGLQENGAFIELRSFVRLGIEWLTVQYARFTEEERRRQRKERRESTRSPRELLSRAQELIQKLPETVLDDQRREATQAINLAIKAIEEHEEEQIGELQMLRVLASTGTMIVVFQHQIIGILEGIRDSKHELSQYASRIPIPSRDRFTGILSHLDGWILDAEHQGKLLGLLLGQDARTQRRRFAIRPIVDKIAGAFQSYMSNNEIEITNRIPAGLRTPPMFECELNAILVNLVTNALKAVKLEPKRSIEFVGSKTGKTVAIHVNDTGKGADKEHWVKYFLPFVGDSVPDPILGAGTGLGLKIVSDFLDVYGGSAEFVDPDEPWRTSIKIVLPL